MRLGPIAFLFAVVIGWAAIRALILWPESRRSEDARNIAWQPPLERRVPPFRPDTPLPAREALSDRPAIARGQPLRAAAEIQPEQIAALLSPPAAPPTDREAPIAFLQPPAPANAERERRLAVSAWAILRGPGTQRNLAAAGQLGGSQAGMRVSYGLGAGFALAGRVSGPLRSSLGKEAAVAIDWRPFESLPVTFTIERRAGLDRGGRDAFAAGVFGGFDAVRLPLGTKLDGYAQAGVVGLRRRDLYADGALRLERPIGAAGRLGIAAGMGLWGGAQPGVARLDAGPQLVIHVPIGRAGLRISAEWRERLAGRALPGSGPALSIGADF